MRAVIKTILPQSTIPFRRAWKYFIKGLNTHILHLQHLALTPPCFEKSTASIPEEVGSLTWEHDWGDRWIQWCDVKPHGNLNLLDAHLLKPMYSSLCSLIPVRDDFDLTGVIFPGTSLGVTATATSPSFLSSQPSRSLKAKTHVQLAQLFGSCKYFPPLFFHLFTACWCQNYAHHDWGCAPGLFLNA